MIKLSTLFIKILKNNKQPVALIFKNNFIFKLQAQIGLFSKKALNLVFFLMKMKNYFSVSVFKKKKLKWKIIWN